jgi:hypothetical protein
MRIETAFALHILVTTALSWIWFKSDFPIYLTKFLRNRYWLPQRADYWPDDISYATWLRHEWETWLTAKDATLAHLLTCPTCFTTRISLASAIWVMLFTGEWRVIPFCIIAVPITVTWLNWTKK